MSKGTVQISERAIMQLIGYITMQFDEIVRLADKKDKSTFSRWVRGDTKGVYIVKGTNGLEIEVCAVCRYGINTSALLTAAVKRIKHELAGTGIKVKSVKIRIVGVDNGA